MDDLDKTLMAELAKNARISVAVLARKLKIARTTVQARIERLETRGIIGGYTLKLGDAALKNRIRATALVQVDPQSTAAVLSRLKQISEVEAAHTTSGRFDLLLQLSCDSTAALDKALDVIGEIEGVQRSESLIHLSTKISRAMV